MISHDLNRATTHGLQRSRRLLKEIASQIVDQFADRPQTVRRENGHSPCVFTLSRFNGHRIAQMAQQMAQCSALYLRTMSQGRQNTNTFNPQFQHNLSTWLQSPALDLSAYAGHTIRVRFLFNSVDAANNSFDGWGIDDFSITAAAPPVCTDLRQDDTPAQATPLVYSTTLTVEAEICPGGDLDYYTFTGAAGDRIAVDITANAVGSLLDDPYLVLLDSDGVSVLTEVDDEVYAVVRDPLLGYTLPHDGAYYLAVRAWNNPSVGGQDYDYTIRLFEDPEPPQLAITWPGGGTLFTGTEY